MARLSKLIPPLLALVALAAIAVVSSGCGTTTADTARGRNLFVQKCGGCHTLAQAGTSGVQGPDLDDAFAAARAIGNDSDTIEGVVEAQVEYPRENNGNPAVSMPAHLVEGQDLADVAAYVGEWAGVPGAEPPKVEGGPGAQVFASKGCNGCHTFEAANASGTTGPPLEKYLEAGETPAKIEEMIVDPNKEIAKGYPPNVMPPNFGELLSEKELEDLVQFLYENSPAGEGAGGSKSKG